MATLLGWHQQLDDPLDGHLLGLALDGQDDRWVRGQPEVDEDLLEVAAVGGQALVEEVPGVALVRWWQLLQRGCGVAVDQVLVAAQQDLGGDPMVVGSAGQAAQVGP